MNAELIDAIKEQVKEEILSNLNVYVSTEPHGFNNTKVVVTITYAGQKVCDDGAIIMSI